MRPGVPQLLRLFDPPEVLGPLICSICAWSWCPGERPAGCHWLLCSSLPSAGLCLAVRRLRADFEELRGTERSLELRDRLLGALQLLAQRLVLVLHCHEMLDLLLGVGMAAKLSTTLGHAKHVALVDLLALLEPPRLNQCQLQVLLLQLQREKNLAVLVLETFIFLVETLKLQILTNAAALVLRGTLGRRSPVGSCLPSVSPNSLFVSCKFLSGEILGKQLPAHACHPRLGICKSLLQLPLPPPGAALLGLQQFLGVFGPGDERHLLLFAQNPLLCFCGRTLIGEFVRGD
mmetsp:Transcript_405/g.684  ORF Transcript_405/g.684 Transcript_405/m.684 type:complete len:290 (-) Transcript_405:23-892(-)